MTLAPPPDLDDLMPRASAAVTPRPEGPSRRGALRLGAGLAVGLVLAGPRRARAQAGITITAAQMQAAVAERFPRRYDASGLMSLVLQPPRLRLLPERDRLQAEMDVSASGPLWPQARQGAFDVDFALRYEASDRSIRAHRLHVNALRVAGLTPEAAAVLQAYGPPLAEQALREVVVHTLTDQDLSLADGLNLQPGSITVTAEGLRVSLVPKTTL